MRVRAYRNLNQPGVVYSLQDASTGRVVDLAETVLVGPVDFVVQAGGRARVIERQRKKVHAWFLGELLATDKEAEKLATKLARNKPWQAVRYNPYLFATFVRASDEKPLKRGEYGLLTKDGAFAILGGVQPNAPYWPEHYDAVEELALW